MARRIVEGNGWRVAIVWLLVMVCLMVMVSPSGAPVVPDPEDIRPSAPAKKKPAVVRKRVVPREEDTEEEETVSPPKATVPPVKKTVAPTKEAVTPKKEVHKSGDTWTDPVTYMEFVWIPAGTFQMGSPDSEQDREADEGPVHEVQLDGFWLGKQEVTRGQFRKFVEATRYRTEAEQEGWSWVRDGKESAKGQGKNWLNPGMDQNDSHPVVCVSWNDAKAMAEWLSKQGNGRFGLPSEAQWEYACRAGTTTARYWGDNSEEACKYANVGDISGKRKFNLNHSHNCDDGYDFTAPVGRFRPNRFGLYDMLGNVWEWCEDIYNNEAYSKLQGRNPINTSGGSDRVLRGGSCYNAPWFVRCARRYHRDAPRRSYLMGFRLARMP